MTVWVIFALILISVVSVTTCGLLFWEVHDLRGDLDLATRRLVEVLERRGDPRKLISGLNGFGSANRF